MLRAKTKRTKPSDRIKQRYDVAPAVTPKALPKSLTGRPISNQQPCLPRGEEAPWPKHSASLLERLNDRSDPSVWRRLVHLYPPLIKGWLRRHGVSVDDGEDLTQDVLGIVVSEVTRFKNNGRVGAVRAWLRTIAVNCLRQSLRSRRLAARAVKSSSSLL
jgi:hypothetical protein